MDSKHILFIIILLYKLERNDTQCLTRQEVLVSWLFSYFLDVFNAILFSNIMIVRRYQPLIVDN